MLEKVELPKWIIGSGTDEHVGDVIRYVGRMAQSSPGNTDRERDE